MSTPEQNKEIALSVSRAIMNGKWNELDSLLDDKFTYTGDGFHFSKSVALDLLSPLQADGALRKSKSVSHLLKL